jgi:S-adenosylmethionine decarboxylase
MHGGKAAVASDRPQESGSLYLPGTEWVVDVYGCPASALKSKDALAAVFDRIVRDLDLHPLCDAAWHAFDGEGGVTGLLMLSESHLACHTFPETGFAAFNLYCCRSRPDWDWQAHLTRLLGAERVSVRRLARGASS